MRLILFAFGILFLINGMAFGDEIFSLDCKQGGSITVDSSGFSYDESTGDFSIVFQGNNCIDEHGLSINGTFTISGSFIPLSETTAQLSANSTINVSLSESGNSRNLNCNGSINGTYNFSTEVFDGNTGLDCSGSGSFKQSFIELLMIGPLSIIPE